MVAVGGHDGGTARHCSNQSRSAPQSAVVESLPFSSSYSLCRSRFRYLGGWMAGRPPPSFLGATSWPLRRSRHDLRPFVACRPARGHQSVSRPRYPEMSCIAPPSFLSVKDNKATSRIAHHGARGPDSRPPMRRGPGAELFRSYLRHIYLSWVHRLVLQGTVSKRPRCPLPRQRTRGHPRVAFRKPGP